MFQWLSFHKNQEAGFSQNNGQNLPMFLQGEAIPWPHLDCTYVKIIYINSINLLFQVYLLYFWGVQQYIPNTCQWPKVSCFDLVAGSLELSLVIKILLANRFVLKNRQGQMRRTGPNGRLLQNLWQSGLQPGWWVPWQPGWQPGSLPGCK